MNKQRRKEIEGVRDQLDAIFGMLESVRGTVEDLQAEEQEYFDNMPESLQGGERGEAAEAAASYLQDAASAVDDLDFQSIYDALDNAVAN